jgi:hypothetical protein
MESDPEDDTIADLEDVIDDSVFFLAACAGVPSFSGLGGALRLGKVSGVT